MGKTCRDCGQRLGSRNTSGFCQHCRGKHRKHTAGNTCPDCGTLISPYAKRCHPCARAHMKARPKVCVVCGHPERVKHQSYCEDCYAEYRKRLHQKYYTSTMREYMHAEPTGEMGRCALCRKEFPLVKGQHSKLHWCPDCQDTHAYQNYASEQAWLSRMTPNPY